MGKKWRRRPVAAHAQQDHIERRQLFGKKRCGNVFGIPARSPLPDSASPDAVDSSAGIAVFDRNKLLGHFEIALPRHRGHAAPVPQKKCTLVQSMLSWYCSAQRRKSAFGVLPPERYFQRHNGLPFTHSAKIAKSRLVPAFLGDVGFVGMVVGRLVY